MTKKIELSGSLLREMYCDQRLTAKQIARILGVSAKTVRLRMKDYGITSRGTGKPTRLLDRNELYRLYHVEMKSMAEIGKMFGVSHEKIRREFKRLSIPSRSGSEAVKNQWVGADQRRENWGNLMREHGLKRQGFRHNHWRGGVEYTELGYRLIYAPWHPRARKNKVREHILIMEAHLGRLLRDDEVVHHKNEIKDDNRIDNLKVMTKSEHVRLHSRSRKWLLPQILAMGSRYA